MQMIKTIEDYKNLDVTIPLLKSEGVFIVENFISGKELEDLTKEFKDLCVNKGTKYNFGKLYRGQGLNSYKGYGPNVYKTFNKDWMKSLTNEYAPGTEYARSIVGTYDYIPNDNFAQQAWLHSDFKKCLKFFLYLSDIDRTSGALYCSPKSVNRGKEIRESLGSVDNYNKHRRLEETYKADVIAFPPEPIEYPAGTLIVFDTDTFHKGGIVEEGNERLVIRSHNK
jgi:hypothetical protein